MGILVFTFIILIRKVNVLGYVYDNDGKNMPILLISPWDRGIYTL